LTEAQIADEIANGPFTASQEVNDLTSAWLGDRVERIGRGCCSGHADYDTYPYKNISSAGETAGSRAPEFTTPLIDFLQA
jgi:hypothetical protein